MEYDYEGFIFTGSLEHRKAMAYNYDNPEAYLTEEERKEMDGEGGYL